MSVENKATQLGRANEADDASGPIQLPPRTRHPYRLIQSTGNLYWSSNPWVIEIQHASKLNVPAPAIFRASKSSQPGEEVALYTESGTGGEWTSSEFGALTFAKVDDEFYGYFVANYTDKSQTTSQIKRIPLGAVTSSGHADVLLDPAPATIGLGDLVTDGSFLCWADSEGIRSMPIGGGTVTPLVEGSGLERLAVLGGTLYYIEGVLQNFRGGGAVICRAGLVASCGSLMAARSACSGCCGVRNQVRRGGRDPFGACRAGRLAWVLWIVAAGCWSGKAGEPAVEQHQVADGRGHGELGLGEGQAAHGELAEPDSVLEEAEPALGQGRAAPVDVAALPGGQVIGHLVAGVLMLAGRSVRAVAPGRCPRAGGDHPVRPRPCSSSR